MAHFTNGKVLRLPHVADTASNRLSCDAADLRTLKVAALQITKEGIFVPGVANEGFPRWKKVSILLKMALEMTNWRENTACVLCFRTEMIICPSTSQASKNSPTVKLIIAPALWALAMRVCTRSAFLAAGCRPFDHSSSISSRACIPFLQLNIIIMSCLVN